MENNNKRGIAEGGGGGGGDFFRMPLHYPRYSKKDYEDMPEWKLDRLLVEYGLPTWGDLPYKRRFAMGAFIWPDFQPSLLNKKVV